VGVLGQFHRCSSSVGSSVYKAYFAGSYTRCRDGSARRGKKEL
jgi:hypothetical protein